MPPLQMGSFGISSGAVLRRLCSLNCIVVVVAPVLVLVTKRNSPLLNMSIPASFICSALVSSVANYLAIFILTGLTLGEIAFTNTGVYIANHSPSHKGSSLF